MYMYNIKKDGNYRRQSQAEYSERIDIFCTYHYLLVFCLLSIKIFKKNYCEL